MAYVSYLGLPISFLISLITYLTDGQKHDMTLVQDLASILYQIGFLIMAGTSSVLSQLLMYVSLKYVDPSKFSILRATDLLYAFLFQYLFLNIFPNLFNFIGAILILFATILIILFQMLEKKAFVEKRNSNISKWKKCLFF